MNKGLSFLFFLFSFPAFGQVDSTYKIEGIIDYPLVYNIPKENEFYYKKNKIDTIYYARTENKKTVQIDYYLKEKNSWVRKNKNGSVIERGKFKKNKPSFFRKITNPKLFFFHQNVWVYDKIGLWNYYNENGMLKE